MFAISRIAGWCAHIIEEKFAEAQDKPALYRPEADIANTPPAASTPCEVTLASSANSASAVTISKTPA
ncbi:MAG: hypothetical protein ACLQNE_46260 [Thermoguttaceae bacterium]